MLIIYRCPRCRERFGVTRGKPLRGCPHCGYAGRIEAPPATPRPRRLGGEVSGR